jgi:hypothetical protein
MILLLALAGILVLFGLHALSGIAIEVAFSLESYLRKRDTAKFEIANEVWIVAVTYFEDQYSQTEDVIGLFRSDADAKRACEEALSRAIVWSPTRDEDGQAIQWLSASHIEGVMHISIYQKEVDGYFSDYTLRDIVEKANEHATSSRVF